MDCRNKGFTLIELSIFLCLVGIILLLSSPLLVRQIDNYRLESDARRLAGVLRDVRQQAVAEGTPQTVKFFIFSGAYQVVGEKTYYLQDGIRFADKTSFKTTIGSTSCCKFTINGSPVTGGTITLANRQNRKKYIIVNPVAGRIRVSEMPPQNW
ncbi:GspH/FimT family pseudopilin [Syntrophomonas erecta]